VVFPAAAAALVAAEPVAGGENLVAVQKAEVLFDIHQNNR
jgi:hypothetical protein